MTDGQPVNLILTLLAGAAIVFMLALSIWPDALEWLSALCEGRAAGVKACREIQSTVRRAAEVRLGIAEHRVLVRGVRETTIETER